MSNARVRTARYRALRSEARRRAPHWQRKRTDGYVYAWATILLGVLLIGVGLLLSGCKPAGGHDPRRVIPSGTAAHAFAACGSEDGGPVYPCAWRCATMGNRQCAPDGSRRVLLYVRDVVACPVTLPDGWVCEATE